MFIFRLAKLIHFKKLAHKKTQQIAEFSIYIKIKNFKHQLYALILLFDFPKVVLTLQLHLHHRQNL